MTFLPVRVCQVSLTLVIVVSACGARTELDHRPIPRAAKPGASAPAKPPAGTPEPAKAQPDDKPPGDEGELPIGSSNMLGECKLGAAPQTGKACPYLARSRCYPDPHSACDCVCPRDVDRTTCVEGYFPNALGAIEVDCFAQ